MSINPKHVPANKAAKKFNALLSPRAKSIMLPYHLIHVNINNPDNRDTQTSIYTVKVSENKSRMPSKLPI